MEASLQQLRVHIPRPKGELEELHITTGMMEVPPSPASTTTPEILGLI